MHKPLTVSEKQGLAELVAAGTPTGEICEVIGRDRWTTRRRQRQLSGSATSTGAETVTAAVESGRARGDALVKSKLRLRWSLQQISGWLSETFPDRPEMWVSHETVYLSLFVQSRGALRKELTRYLAAKPHDRLEAAARRRSRVAWTPTHPALIAHYRSAHSSPM